MRCLAKQTVAKQIFITELQGFATNYSAGDRSRERRAGPVSAEKGSHEQGSWSKHEPFVVLRFCSFGPLGAHLSGDSDKLAPCTRDRHPDNRIQEVTR